MGAELTSWVHTIQRPDNSKASRIVLLFRLGNTMFSLGAKGAAMVSTASDEEITRRIKAFQEASPGVHGVGIELTEREDNVQQVALTLEDKDAALKFVDNEEEEDGGILLAFIGRFLFPSVFKTGGPV